MFLSTLRKIVFQLHASRMNNTRRLFFSQFTAGSDMHGTDSKFSSAAKYLAGLSAFGAVIYFTPLLPETKQGLREAFSNKRRNDPGPWWNWLFGGLGFVAGFGGTTAYVNRVGAYYPVLGGFKTPWALFGAIMGGQLCYQLTPILLDASGVISRTIAYASDGLIADTVGRSEGQVAAWKRASVWDRMLGIDGRKEDDESDDIILPHRKTASHELGNAAQTPQDKEKTLMTMARRLVELRRKEAALKSHEGASFLSSSDRKRFRELQAPELAAIDKEKKSLKSEALTRGGVRLSKYVSAEINAAADELTQLRLRQYVLAQELAAGGTSPRRAELRREIERLDEDKARLKRAAHRIFGVPIARVARPVPTWRDVLRRAAAAAA